MRLLVFEFITGGGFVDNSVPASLLQEAYLMRNALLADLSEIIDLDILVLQDRQLVVNESTLAPDVEYIMIAQGDDLREILSTRQSMYDSVWLIAPETDGILAQWSQFFFAQGKLLYTSAQQAIEICQDKLATIKQLQKSGIKCVPSRFFQHSDVLSPESQVIKVNDSVGCDQVYLVSTELDWQSVLPKLFLDKSYVIQPYITGKTLSLSALFSQGKAYYICCNRQHTHIEQQQFVLTACTVNIDNKYAEKYQVLCQAIADAIPGLFGYIGIDFIETETGELLIMEINPRLTTSYAAIKEALGINIAELVLNLPDKLPVLHRSRNQQVLISIDLESSYAN